MKRSNIKSTKTNEEVRRVLAEIIRSDVKDPRISSMCSVVSVDVTRDLKLAKVYISVLGDEAAVENTMKGLKSSAGFIRNRLAQRLNLRNTPELNFVSDQSIAYGVSMTKKIDEVMEEIHKRDEEEEA